MVSARMPCEARVRRTANDARAAPWPRANGAGARSAAGGGMPPVQLRPRIPRRLASAPAHAATQLPATWDRPLDALTARAVTRIELPANRARAGASPIVRLNHASL